MVFDWRFEHTFTARQRHFALRVNVQSHSQNLVLFGTSGSGKTLTLQAVAGLLRPQTGRIQVAGQCLFDQSQGIDLTPQQRRMGYVFQDYALFPHLTVRQNVAFALKQGWSNPSKEFSHDQVTYWLDALGLSAVQNHWPDAISGGQQQRVALARALVAKPEALLLDEPFSALDQHLRSSLRRELKNLQSELQLPLVLITHDPQDLDMFGEDVIDVQDGCVLGGNAASEASTCKGPL